MPRSFASLDDFLADDPRRNGGDHLPLGGWWRSVEGAVYAAAWAPGSGELYVTSHDSGRVKVVGAPMSRRDVVTRLDNWRDVVGRRASIEWLLAQAAPRTNRAPAAGIGSKGWTCAPESWKRTVAVPLGALSPAA